MFYGCYLLPNIPFGNIDTSIATDMSGFAYYCKAIKFFDGTGFDMSNVTTAVSMCAYCSSLETIDISTWTKMPKLTNLGSFLLNCPKLKTFIGKDIDVSSVTSFSQSFRKDAELEELDLSGWYTTSATTYYYMFADCTSLRRLDIRNFSFSDEIQVSGMFSNVPNDCVIIVADDNAKARVLGSNSKLTGVVTVAELEQEEIL